MKKFKNITIEIIIVIFGSALFALGVHSFTAPNDIAPGGLTGISTILNHLFGLPIGISVAVMNIPLIIIGFIFLGKRMMIKTVISLAAFTAFLDYLFAGIPVYRGENILASLFGGVLIGVGLGFVYMKEATTGGMDIVNKLIQLKFPHIRLGQITFATDAAVIAAAVLAYGNLESALFAVISIYASAKVIDSFIYGINEAKMMLIISDMHREIAEKILKMGRGVTLLKGTGVYSGSEKNVICCAAAKNEYFKIKRNVKEIDKNAFIIITNAGEVFGEGFG